jgi:translation initiation factor 2 alpha subunit (eIF-2alpha)
MNDLVFNKLEIEEFQFYSTNKPEINENVLVQFIERKDAYFKAKLIEYSLYEGILNFQDATKKRKIKSWNNIVVLNKNSVAKVEDVDDVKKIVKLSLIYLKNECTISFFNENKIMEKFVNTFCIINKYNFNEIWNNIVHKIDISRRLNNNNLSLWNYFITNKNLFESQSEEYEIYNNLIKLYIKKYENINYKQVSKFGIISNIGIDVVKNIFKNILLNIKCNNILKYDTAPNYLFETNITDDNLIHDTFINNLKNAINTYNISNKNQVIFLKIEYIGKNI